MYIPTKELKNGFTIPVYGLGTWQMGGSAEADYSNDELYTQAIKNAIDLGITHIDTAESYGSGHTEELIGEAIEDYDRSKLIIVSKVSAWNQSYQKLLDSFEKSIKNLKTDYLDLYLLHRYPEPGIDVKETMRALDFLVANGKVKNIGVCNMTIPMIEECQKNTKNKIVYNQLHYSLECREIVDKNILEYCQNNDILVSAWGPLSKGNLKTPQLLRDIAEKYNNTPFQVAINWLVSQNNVVVIPKTTSTEHLKENFGALGWALEQEDMDKLMKEYPNQMIVSDRVPLNYETDLK